MLLDLWLLLAPRVFFGCVHDDFVLLTAVLDTAVPITVIVQTEAKCL